MLTSDQIKNIDTQDMYKTYENWPEIAEQTYHKKFDKLDVKDIDHIVFAGMGGSGTIGDIFSSILSKTNLHVSVVKGYSLPKTVNERTLIMCTSISGNTEETLSILENAKKSNARFVSMSSGGKMEDFCEKNNLKFYKIKKYHSPRASLLGFLYAALNIFEEIIQINKNDVNESIKSLYELKKGILVDSLYKKNMAIELAEWIKEIPMLYYPWGLESVAIRFKNSMQENAKKHVMYEDVIETCHNGIVSWEKSSNVQPILIRGSNDHKKTIERWDIIKEFFQEKNITYKEIFSVDGNILSKIVCLIYILDMTSIYNAVIGKIDPSPVNSIDFIKDKL
jgi:glucose/mannose-6-phosphate isomerase